MKATFQYTVSKPSDINSIDPFTGQKEIKAPKKKNDAAQRAIVVPIMLPKISKDSEAYATMLESGRISSAIPAITNADVVLRMSNGSSARLCLKRGHARRTPVYAWVWHKEDSTPMDRFSAAASLAAVVTDLSDDYDHICIDLSNTELIVQEFSQIDLFSIIDGYEDLEEELLYALEHSSYEYKTRHSPVPARTITVEFVVTRDNSESTMSRAVELTASNINTAEIISTARNLSRYLGDLPGNLCDPETLAQHAKAVAIRPDTVTKPSVCVDVEAINEFESNRSAFGAVNAVAAGSAKPPKVVVLKYMPADSTDDAPIVLIGKGVTFDAGGVSIKPSAKMGEMKYDMCGAATVISVMHALGRLPKHKLPRVPVIGIIVAAENVLGPDAVKPGDVITSYSGKTIEILNTDAEGRLLLADMLSWSQARFKPSTIIDIATLTGAVASTLDSVYAGLFSNDVQLAQQLQTLGECTDDLLWQLPMHRDYDKKLKSKFADVPNIGTPGAGGSVAAHFLKRFVDDGVKWAHLDIAGVAWGSGGATGFGTRLLLKYLASVNCELRSTSNGHR